MADELLFSQLKAPVEPLVETFSAWSHTVASEPDTMNLISLRFPNLESYLKSPEVHVEANRNPEPHGGFFLDVAEERSSPWQPPPDVPEPPFSMSSTGLERLCGTRVPVLLGSPRDVLEPDDARAEQPAELVSETAGPPPHRHVEAGGRIRYFGRACLVLQTPEGAVVTDPFIGTGSGARDRYTLDDLPDFIDLVLVTHGHQDRIVLETLLQLRGRIGTIVAPRSSQSDPEGTSTGLFLRRLGFPVVEADDYDEFTFPGGSVVATPFLGEHGAQDVRGESTYWVRLAGRSAFVGTDSSGMDPAPYRRIRQNLGTADYAFLGMEREGAPLTWLYQALLPQLGAEKTSNSRKAPGLSAEQAVAIMTDLGVGETYVHPVGEEPWPWNVMAAAGNEGTYQAKQIDELMKWCADHGIKAERLVRRQEWRW
ncbi:MBL fold metallo-hydrolase [Streptomyces sp. NBC_01508]|uniref:MBL fold metallo-hydrolase n=1 Tax=Streptomyces sp. NBC_01508 TaxID=2903888 RepID=UPI00386FE811